MSRKYLTYISCFALMLYAINITVISPLIMEIANTFDLDISKVGVIFTFTFIGFTIFIMISGFKADKIGKKLVLNIAVVGLTIAIWAFSIAPAFWIICLSSFFIGGFGGMLESIASAYIHDINHEKPEYYVNMSQIFFGMGAIVGPIGVGVAISNGISWRVCYMALGIISILFSILFLQAKDVSKPHLESVSSGLQAPTQIKFSTLFKNKTFLLVCLCMFFYTGSEVGGWGWMCTYLDKSFAFTPAKASLAVALFWTSLTIGRILCGVLTLHFKITNIIIVLAFSSSVFTIMSVFVQNEIGIFLTIVAMGFAYSSLFPLIISYGGEQIKQSSGRVFSVMIAGAGLGNMIIPYLMGVIGDAVHMRVAMILPAILLFFTGMIFYYFKKARAV